MIFSRVTRQSKLTAIPLITYNTPTEELYKLADGGACLFKIKLGADPDGDGDCAKMLSADKKRALDVHNILKNYNSEYTDSGKIMYYFDANGRYDTKERLSELIRFFADNGILESTLLFEEPFAEHSDIFIGDLPVVFAADESVHSVSDVKKKADLRYKAITLKPIAKFQELCCLRQ